MSHTTGCTLDSSWRTSRAYRHSEISMLPAWKTPTDAHTFSHSLCTSLSASCLHVIRLSIQPSSVGIVVGSVVGTDDIGMGSDLTSSMFVSIFTMFGSWCLAGTCGFVVGSCRARGFLPLQTGLGTYKVGRVSRTVRR
jgi:hypothetical protein